MNSRVTYRQGRRLNEHLVLCGAGIGWGRSSPGPPTSVFARAGARSETGADSDRPRGKTL